jgi:hypothetical protein
MEQQVSDFDGPSARLARLRADLLHGRGPGASVQEVAEHTRDRPFLGAVPPPVERSLVARQSDRLRAGEPIRSVPVRPTTSGRQLGRQLGAALVGAATALLAGSLVVRFLRSHHPPRR